MPQRAEPPEVATPRSSQLFVPLLSASATMNCVCVMVQWTMQHDRGSDVTASSSQWKSVSDHSEILATGYGLQFQTALHCTGYGQVTKLGCVCKPAGDHRCNNITRPSLSSFQTKLQFCENTACALILLTEAGLAVQLQMKACPCLHQCIPSSAPETAHL